MLKPAMRILFPLALAIAGFLSAVGAGPGVHSRQPSLDQERHACGASDACGKRMLPTACTGNDNCARPTQLVDVPSMTV